VRAIENRQPHLLEPFRCLSERRAVVKTSGDEAFKLIEIENDPAELFNLTSDPLELEEQMGERPYLAQSLHEAIQGMPARDPRQQETLRAGDEIELNDSMRQQLRALGYIE
jgi:hypothetical protein